MGTKLAVMQPYFFPYIGYFQLIQAADTLVFYDDVTYIKQGWINRNRLMYNNEIHYFTVPLENQSSFRLINEHRIDQKHFPKWKKTFFKTLFYEYHQAPFYEETLTLLERCFEKNEKSIDDFNRESVRLICSYLNIETVLINSSSIYENKNLKAQERILDICRKEKATVYINLIGGKELYSKELFKTNGINLLFLESQNIEYKRKGLIFEKNLSIIDVLMYNSKERVKAFLNHYTLN